MGPSCRTICHCTSNIAHIDLLWGNWCPALVCLFISLSLSLPLSLSLSLSLSHQCVNIMFEIVIVLQVTRTCIKSSLSSNFGHVQSKPHLSVWLISDWLIIGKWCLHDWLFIFYWIIIKITCNKDMHKSLKDFGVTWLWTIALLLENYSKYFDEIRKY